jgi:hypothetical protein
VASTLAPAASRSAWHGRDLFSLMGKDSAVILTVSVDPLSEDEDPLSDKSAAIIKATPL